MVASDSFFFLYRSYFLNIMNLIALHQFLSLSQTVNNNNNQQQCFPIADFYLKWEHLKVCNHLMSLIKIYFRGYESFLSSKNNYKAYWNFISKSYKTPCDINKQTAKWKLGSYKNTLPLKWRFTQQFGLKICRDDSEKY